MSQLFYEAEIAVANIGTVHIDPDSRVRLVSTGADLHRLELAEGGLHAKVNAPPRLFMVDTKAATAVDLGCAYSLRVSKQGVTRLVVTRGWVALERKGVEMFVPAAAAAESRLDGKQSTPCFIDSAAELKSALRKFDFENSGDTEIQIILDNVEWLDTLTLYRLLSRVSINTRGKIIDRMTALSKPPDGVTREGTLRLDPAMLTKWSASLELDWMSHPDILGS